MAQIRVEDEAGNHLGDVREGDTKLDAMERLSLREGTLLDNKKLGLLDTDTVSFDKGPYVWKINATTGKSLVRSFNVEFIPVNKTPKDDTKPKKVCTRDQFNMQLNGGRFGKGPKLHDHGFELTPDGTIRCTMCNAILVKHQNIPRHATQNETHRKLYQKKLDGGLLLSSGSVSFGTRGLDTNGG